MALTERIKNAWNAFRQAERDAVSQETYVQYGPSYSVSPSRTSRLVYNERTIISSIYMKIGVDVAGVQLRHIKLDNQERYLKTMDSELNTALNLEPNIDQGPRAFRQDLVMTLFDKGVAAVVPVDTINNPNTNEIFDILSLRVGDIVAWYPNHVKVSLYNEAIGERKEITLPKRYVAIVENPFYAVMNEPNSTLQRLIRKLNLLDIVDEQSGSGKLDLIIQLPYTIKSEARRLQAEQRRDDIEFQLKDSKYGIAYTDATEKITQLNRPAENNLLAQVEYLVNLLYDQLGLTETVLNGTADAATMTNYYNRTVEPILDAMIEAMQRSFLGRAKTRRRERIKYFRDPLKLIPVTEIAELANSLTRNEIVTANEFRPLLGLMPSSDPKADQLVNSNMPNSGTTPATESAPAPELDMAQMDSIIGEVFDGLASDIDEIVGGLDAGS